jgi:hypothetical protein
MSDAKEREKEEAAAALARMAGASGTAPGSAGAAKPRSNRPAAPGASGAAPSDAVPPPPQPAKSRPAAPSRAPSAPVADHASPNVEDDDAVIVPAPTPDMFLPRRRPTTSVARKRLLQSMPVRRTLIPIMLTGGLILLSLGGLWFTTDTTSPFRKPGDWVPYCLFGVGVVLLGMGFVNALQVRHELKSRRP